MDFTTTALIASIKRQITMPTAQQLMSDQDLCDWATDSQQKYVVPQLLNVKDEFFVDHVDYTLVNGQLRYAIPSRAIGQRVRMIQILDLNQKVVAVLQRIQPEIAELSTQGSLSGNMFATPTAGYFFEGNDIVLLSDPVSTLGKYLRVKFYRRRGKLALTSNAGQVQSIVGSLVTLSNVPANWVVGSKVDFINDNSPFDSQGDSVEILGISGFDVTFDTADLTDLTVGAWVCNEGESTIPQIPQDLHIVLALYACVDILKSLGDTQGMQNAMTELVSLKDSLFSQTADRDDGSNQKVISADGIFSFDDYPRWRF